MYPRRLSYIVVSVLVVLAQLCSALPTFAQSEGDVTSPICASIGEPLALQNHLEPVETERLALSGNIVYMSAMIPHDWDPSMPYTVLPHRLFHRVHPLTGTYVIGVVESSQYMLLMHRSGRQYALIRDDQTLEIRDSDEIVTDNIQLPPGSGALLDWSLDGLHMLIVAMGEDDQSEQIWLLNIETHEARKLTSGGSRHLFASFSPDGKEIVYFRDYRMWRMNLDGSNARQLLETESRAMAWSPDGLRIVFEGPRDDQDYLNSDLWLVNADGSNPQKLVDTANRIESWPAWSPDGTQIVYEVRADSFALSNLAVLDLATGTETLYASSDDDVAPVWTTSSSFYEFPSTLPVPLTPPNITSSLQGVEHETIGFLAEGGFWTVRGDGRGATRRDLFAETEPVRVFAWSGDGNRVALGTSEGLYLIDAHGSPPIRIASAAAFDLMDWQGNTLAFLTRTEDDTPDSPSVQIAIIDTDQPTAETRYLPAQWNLPIGEWIYKTLSVSPDGRYVAINFMNAQGIYDVETGVQVGTIATSQEEWGGFWDPAWHPDGSHLLYSRNGPGPRIEMTGFDVHAVALPSGDESIRSSLLAQHLAFSPDGSLLALTTPNLSIASYPDGAPSPIFEGMVASPAFSPDSRFVLFEVVEKSEFSWGVNLLSTRVLPLSGGNEYVTLPIGASNAAWRPRPGGTSEAPLSRWESVDNGLTYQGKHYDLSLLLKPEAKSITSESFLHSSLQEDGLSNAGVLRVALTRNGTLVTDAKEVRRIITLFVMAHRLMQVPPDHNHPEIQRDLNIIIYNPLFLLLAPDSVLVGNLPTRWSGEQFLAEEVLTEMLTSNADIEDKFGAVFVERNELAGGASDFLNALPDFIDALDGYEFSAAFGQDLAGASGGVVEAFERHTALVGELATVTNAAVHQLAVAYMEQERADWLEEYLDGGAGNTSMLEPEIAAVARDVIDDTASHFRQRMNLLRNDALEWAAVKLVSGFSALVVDLGGFVTSKSAMRAFMKQVSGVYAAGALVGWLYDADGVYMAYSKASTALELAETFHQGRVAIEGNAWRSAQGNLDGNVAEEYRAAYLLEEMAGIVAEREYAEGLRATVGNPASEWIIDNLSLEFGTAGDGGREEVVKDLLLGAAVREQALLDGYANPPFLGDLLALANISGGFTADDVHAAESANGNSAIEIVSDTPNQAVLNDTTFVTSTAPMDMATIESALDQSSLKLGRLSVEIDEVDSIRLVGDYLYGTTPYSLHVFDVAQPAYPRLVNSLDIEDLFPVVEIEAHASMLYILNPDGFFVVDISAPIAPRLINHIREDSLTHIVTDIAFWERDGRLLAFLSDAGREDRALGDSLYGHVVLLDVTDPARVYHCATWNALGRSSGLVRIGDTLIVGTGPDHNGRGRFGLQVFDLAPSRFMETLAFLDLPDGALDQIVSGQMLYVFGSFFGDSQLRRIDIANSVLPRQTHAAQVSGMRAMDKAPEGVYVVTDSSVYQFADNGTTLDLAAAAPITYFPSDSEAGQEAIYLATSDGIVVVDLPLPLLAGIEFVVHAAPLASTGGDLGASQIEEDSEVGSVLKATVVADGRVNVREGPGTSFLAFAQLSPGTIVTIVESPEDSIWTRVQLSNGSEGWVAAEFLTSSESRTEGPHSDVGITASPTVTLVPTPDSSVCPFDVSEALDPVWDQAVLGCPTSNPGVTWASFAQFERGIMLWRRDEGRIYGFFNTGWWLSVADSWDGEAAPPSRGSPPNGLSAPIRGMGNIWGTQDEFFDELGWMLDEQKGFCAIVQSFEKGTMIWPSQEEFCHEEQLYNTARESDFGFHGMIGKFGGGWISQ